MSVAHAMHRAKRRFGIEISANDVQNMADEIMLGNAEFLAFAPGDRKIYKVDCKGQSMPVVFDETRRHIVTVLPAHVLERAIGGKGRPRLRRKREIDPEDLRVRAVEFDPNAEVPHEEAPNNALAEALKAALQKAGII